MLNWQYYPKSKRIIEDLEKLIEVFKKHYETLSHRIII